MSNEEEPLSVVPRGEARSLRRVAAPPGVRRRLLELGFVPGTAVRVVGVAPLGDPFEVEVRSCRISIRREELATLYVAPAAR